MREVPRSRLLLLELVCDLFIFTLCAVVCTALLLRAKSMSQESTQLAQAVYITQDAAERVRAGRPLCAHYRADGTPMGADSTDGPPSYTVSVTDTPDGSRAEVSVYPYQSPEHSPLYTLTVAREVAS